MRIGGDGVLAGVVARMLFDIKVRPARLPGR